MRARSPLIALLLLLLLLLTKARYAYSQLVNFHTRLPYSLFYFLIKFPCSAPLLKFLIRFPYSVFSFKSIALFPYLFVLLCILILFCFELVSLFDILIRLPYSTVFFDFLIQIPTPTSQCMSPTYVPLVLGSRTAIDYSLYGNRPSANNSRRE